MSRFLSVFVMLVLSASLFAIDVNIPENEAVLNGGAIVSDVQHVGTLLWTFEAQTLGLTGAYDLGVEIYAGHFLIITEGQTALEFHVIDLLDSTIHSFGQGGATGWGYRDLCMDEGDTFYTSYTAAIHGWVLDTNAWTMTYVNSYNGVTNPNRALAYVPGDTFWTANFSSALGWFTKGGASGAGSPANACYGAAYVPSTGLVWYHGQVDNAGGWKCTWFMYDIVANAWADTAYCPVPAFAAGYTNKMAGGGCFVQDFLGMGPALIGLCQGDMDFVYAFTFPELSPSTGYFWDFEDGWQGWTHTSDSLFPAGWGVVADTGLGHGSYICPDAGDSSMWIDSDAAGSGNIQLDTVISPAFASFPETYLKWGIAYNYGWSDTCKVLLGQWSGGAITWTILADYTFIDTIDWDSVDVSGYSADSLQIAFYYYGNWDWYAAFDNVGPITVLGVEETPVEMPQLFNYRMLSSNPIANNAVIEFALPINGTVNFTVYDVTGRTVLMQNHGVLNAGVHSLTWNRNDNSGCQVAAGSYFFRLEAAGNVVTGKFVVTE